MDLLPIPTGMIVLAIVAVLVAIVAHWRINRFVHATLASTVITPLIFLAVSTLQSGFPVPLEVLAFVYFAGFALLVAALVGVAFAVVRRPQPAGA